MFQKIPQRWNHLRNSLSLYNGTYVYLRNVANSVWGYYQWERQQKWITDMFGGVLLVLCKPVVCVWDMWRSTSILAGPGLPPHYLCVLRYLCLICIMSHLCFCGVKKMDLDHHLVLYLTSSSRCCEEGETDKDTKRHSHLSDCSVSKGCGINPDLSRWSSCESSYPSSMRFDYLRSFCSCSHSCKYNTCCVT